MEAELQQIARARGAAFTVRLNPELEEIGGPPRLRRRHARHGFEGEVHRADGNVVLIDNGNARPRGYDGKSNDDWEGLGAGRTSMAPLPRPLS